MIYHSRIFMANRVLLQHCGLSVKSKATMNTPFDMKCYLFCASTQKNHNKLFESHSNCAIKRSFQYQQNSCQMLNFHTYPPGKLSRIVDKNRHYFDGRNLSIRLLHKDNVKQKDEPSKSVLLNPKAIVESSPPDLQPYLRLIRFDKPIGTWLLFLPCTWSISLATPAGCLPDASILALFACGAFFMRGAGCTINDMWDKDFDARVERTKDRPLACGQISDFRALSFLGLQLSAALAILLTFNWYTVILGASSMALVIVYPLMKRFTYWPQAFLGLTLNWGVLLAWSAVCGSVELPGVLLYLACTLHTMLYDTIYSHQGAGGQLLKKIIFMSAILFPRWLPPIIKACIRCLTFNWGALLGWSATAGSVAWFPALTLYAGTLAWTMVYDTIYAHQDKDDDILIGVKSTALRFGEHTKPWLVGFSSLMLGCLTCTGLLCQQTWPYYTGLGMVAVHLAHQIYSVDLNDSEDCAKKFRSNKNLGLMFWFFIMAGTWLKIEQPTDKDTECVESLS